MLRPGDIAFVALGSIISYTDVQEHRDRGGIGSSKIISSHHPKYGNACLVISRKSVDVHDYVFVLTRDRLLWVDEKWLALNLNPLVKHDAERTHEVEAR